MFKHIVVLGEESTHVRLGSLLAQRIARVAGGSVMPPPEMLISPVSDASRPGPLAEQGESREKSPGKAGPSPSAATGQEMQAPESDLMLIIGPGKRAPWMLEHVAQRAASYPPVPILILRAGAPILARTPLVEAHVLRPPTTVVALDGSREAEEAIMPAAHLTATLAAPARGSLHLTRVVLRPDIQDVLRDRARIDPCARDQIMKEAMGYLHQVTNDLRPSLEDELGLAVTWSIALDSDVVNALVETAEQGHVVGGTCLFGGCDLLALATHRRDPKGYWIPGNVTGRLFTSTKLPLFLV